MLRLLCLCAMLMGSEAGAGAWPRGKDRVFVSALTYATRFETYTGLYAEWGASDRLTFGLDLGRAVSGNEKMVAMFRLPLGGGTGNTRLAWELGAGRIGGRAVIRPGLSWGRGLRIGDRHGWAAIDSVAEVYVGTGAIDLKSDATLGLTLSPGRSAMLQLQAGVQQGDDPFLRLVPSLALDVGPRAKVEFGVTQSLRGDFETGVKLALWLEF